MFYATITAVNWKVNPKTHTVETDRWAKTVAQDLSHNAFLIPGVIVEIQDDIKPALREALLKTLEDNWRENFQTELSKAQANGFSFEWKWQPVVNKNKLSVQIPQRPGYGGQFGGSDLI